MSLSLLSAEIAPALLRLASVLDDRDFLVREDGWLAPSTTRTSDAASTMVEIIALVVGLDEIEDVDRIEDFARGFAHSRNFAISHGLEVR